MDYQEAIKEAEIQIDMYEGMILYNKDFEPKNNNSNYERKMDFLKTTISAIQELQQYEEIGTLEEVREAVERQKPKTPTYDGDGYADGTFVWDEWICPRCGTRYDFEYDDYDYCPNCGQKIDLHADWSEEDD